VKNIISIASALGTLLLQLPIEPALRTD